MSDEKLIGCPWCKKKPTASEEHMQGCGDWFYVSHNCRVVGELKTQGHKRRSNAVRAWNRRNKDE